MNNEGIFSGEIMNMVLGRLKNEIPLEPHMTIPFREVQFRRTRVFNRVSDRVKSDHGVTPSFLAVSQEVLNILTEHVKMDVEIHGDGWVDTNGVIS